MSKPKVASPQVIEYAETHGIDLTTVQASGGAGAALTLDDVRAAREMPYTTPLVARMAAQHNVDLRDVQGTGVGGRIRKSDVQRTAGVVTDETIIEMRAATQASQDAIAHYAARSVDRRGTAWALNPLVDHARAELRGQGATVPTASAPTLFAGGDLPAWTASGIDPGELLKVPAVARHALAAAPTRAEAYKIMNDCTVGSPSEGVTGEQMAASVYSDHPGNADYSNRVAQWAASRPMTDADFDAADPVMAQMLARADAEIAAHDAAARERLGL